MLRYKQQTTAEIYLESCYFELRPVLELPEWENVLEVLEKSPQNDKQRASHDG